MDFDEASELRDLRSVARHVASAAAGRPGEPEPDAEAVWSALSGQGWGALAVPERYGGSGAALDAVAVVSGECARAGLPSTLRSTLCAGLLVERFGADDQRARWLPRPGAGAAATVCASGSARLVGSTLDGELAAVPDPDLAAFVVVVLPDGSGHRLCVLDPVAGQLRRRDAVSGRPLGRLHVPELGPEQLHAGPSLDGPTTEAATDLVAALTAVDLVGAADGLLARTVEHVCAREQFGRPLGSFQAVQHHAADMATALEGARLLVADALSRLAGGGSGHREVAAAKAHAGRAATRISLMAHQLHGAIGYVTESRLYRLSQRVESDALLGGTADEHLDGMAGRYRPGPARTLELDALDHEPTASAIGPP